MDIFQHRYYRTTKNLMLVSGQWPYLTLHTRLSYFAFILFTMSIMGGMLIMAFFKYREDWDILLDCVLTGSIGLFCLTKHFTTLRNSEKMLKLLNRMRRDWIVWAEEREINILHKYAEQGRKYINAYTVACYWVVFVYITQPLLPKMIDVMLHNVSELGQFPSPVYIYHLDVQKYYFYIIFYFYVMGFTAMTISLSHDAVLLSYVQHCCGIFTALGHKLESVGVNEKSARIRDTEYVSKHRNRAFESLIFTYIARHKDAIDYANLIEMTYSWGFFVTMLFRLPVVSIAGLQVITKMNEPQETVKSAACAVCMMWYVYLESYFAQVLSDHSVSIGRYVQNGQWYSMSLKTQKLLLIMMIRCNVPCQLTAGRIVNISVESFAIFLKTSVSYLTVLCSIRDV